MRSCENIWNGYNPIRSTSIYWNYVFGLNTFGLKLYIWLLKEYIYSKSHYLHFIYPFRHVISYQLKLTTARLKKGTAQWFRLAYSARVFFNDYIYVIYSRSSIIRGTRFWGQNLVRPTYIKYSKTSIIHTFIIRTPLLSAVFETKIQYAQVPRIIEVWLYMLYSETLEIIH